jgi:DNA-binding SARP family transcriptional activator/TolB-like protein
VLYLRTLGRLELLDSTGSSIERLLARPKRLALLVYLAITSARSSQRRDILLSVFWPENDEERGRLALRQALLVLRREVGKAAVQSVGDDALTLDPEHVWCDAVAFKEALQQGRLEDALEYYGGDLLPGFFLSESPGFENWLETTRAELRAAAALAAGTLADTAHAAGSFENACLWARRAHALIPADEAAARRLMTVLEAAGDVAGALQAYEAFARNLVSAYDVTPSLQTIELTEGIRARAQQSSRWARRFASEQSAPQDLVVRRERATSSLPVASPRNAKARRALVAGAISLLVLAAAFATSNRFRLGSPDSAVSSDHIAVLPFKVQGNPEYAYLSHGIVDLLSTKLSGAGSLSVVSPGALLPALGPADRPIDLENAKAVAARLGAGGFIRGSITESGGRLHIQASLFRSASPMRLSAEASVEGKPDRLFEMLDRLAAQLLGSVAPAPDQRLAHMAVLTTNSLPALKAYLQGEAEMRAARFASAAQYFEQAVAEDSTFAMASYRLAFAGVWSGDQAFFAPAVLLRALRHAGRLSEHDRMLIRAFYAWRRGDAEQAEQFYTAVLRSRIDDIEAWHQLGETLFHYNPMRGNQATVARSAFEHVLALDSEHYGALWHLAAIAALEKRSAAVDSLLLRLVRVNPNAAEVLAVRVLQACLRGDPQGQAPALRHWNAKEDLVILDLASRCAMFAGNLRAADHMVRYVIDRQQSAVARTDARAFHAYLSIAQGKVRQALAQLDTLAAYDAETALQLRIWFALSPVLPPPASVLTDLRNRAERIERNLPDVARKAGSRPHTWTYALGLLSAALDEEEKAIEYANALERLPDPAGTEGASRGFAQSVRAHAAVKRDHPTRALQAMNNGQMYIWYGAPIRRTGLDQARENYLRAELLERAGHGRDALRWYSTLGGMSTHDVLFLALSHLRRAEIYQRLREPANAAQHYARFVSLWEHADSELQPVVSAARARYQHLSRLK